MSFRYDKSIFFANDGSSFRVTKDDPLEANIFEMFGADLSGVCSKAIGGTILGSDPIVELLVGIEGEYRCDV